MARRGKGEGTIYFHRRDKDGREVWRIRWPLGRDASGKYRYGNMLVHGTKEEAKKKLREILSKRDKGVPVEPARETVKGFLERWLRDYKATLSPTTRASYKHIIDAHLIPAFGSLRLNQVTPQRLQAYYQAKLAEGLSPTTVRYHARVLHAAFRQAMKEGLLGVNPVDLTEPPKPAAFEGKVWTREQALKFLEVAEPADPTKVTHPADRYYALWVLLLSTGLRIGEALALRWEHVHLDHDPPYLEVKASWYEITQKEAEAIGAERRGAKAPKSRKSVRLVVLDRRTAEVLRQHRQRQELEKRVMGDKYRDEGRVFATLDGRAPYRSNVYEHFAELTKKANLPRIRLHDLRHTHDTHLKQAGVHPRDQQERLGHATLAMAERYTHVLTPDQIEAVRRWEAFFYGDSKATEKAGQETAQRIDTSGV